MFEQVRIPDFGLPTNREKIINIFHLSVKLKILNSFNLCLESNQKSEFETVHVRAKVLRPIADMSNVFKNVD